MIHWEKSGCLFKAEGQEPWMISHTATPLPVMLDEERVRVYFAARSERNNPRPGYVEFNLIHFKGIEAISPQPLVDNGPLAFFDYNGIYPGCIIKRGKEWWMYYSGRVNGDNNAYHVSVGLAISDDEGKTFKKYSESPVHQKNIYDPWLVSTPHVIPYGEGWRMYYLSGRKATMENDVFTSYYDIRSALSDDGITWTAENKVHLGLTDEITNLACPSIVKVKEKYWMFFSFCSIDTGQYRLGVAYSYDLDNWTQIFNCFNSVNDEEWDDISRAYPYVLVLGNYLYVFYCGNNFGKGGFGYLKAPIADFK